MQEVEGDLVPEGHLTVAHHFSGGKTRPPLSVQSRTAEIPLQIWPQSSLRDLGDNGSPLVPPLKRWATINRPWRDYAAWPFLWKRREPVEPQSALWCLGRTKHTSPPYPASQRVAPRGAEPQRTERHSLSAPLRLCVRFSSLAFSELRRRESERKETPRTAFRSSVP